MVSNKTLKQEYFKARFKRIEAESQIALFLTNEKDNYKSIVNYHKFLKSLQSLKHALNNKNPNLKKSNATKSKNKKVINTEETRRPDIYIENSKPFLPISYLIWLFVRKNKNYLKEYKSKHKVLSDVSFKKFGLNFWRDPAQITADMKSLNSIDPPNNLLFYNLSELTNTKIAEIKNTPHFSNSIVIFIKNNMSIPFNLNHLVQNFRVGKDNESNDSSNMSKSKHTKMNATESKFLNEIKEYDYRDSDIIIASAIAYYARLVFKAPTKQINDDINSVLSLTNSISDNEFRSEDIYEYVCIFDELAQKSPDILYNIFYYK